MALGCLGTGNSSLPFQWATGAWLLFPEFCAGPCTPPSPLELAGVLAKVATYRGSLGQQQQQQQQHAYLPESISAVSLTSSRSVLSFSSFLDKATE